MKRCSLASPLGTREERDTCETELFQLPCHSQAHHQLAFGCLNKPQEISVNTVSTNLEKVRENVPIVFPKCHVYMQIPYDPSGSLPGVYPKQVFAMSLGDMYKNFHSRRAHNSQKLKTTSVFTHRKKKNK